MVLYMEVLSDQLWHTGKEKEIRYFIIHLFYTVQIDYKLSHTIWNNLVFTI